MSCNYLNVTFESKVLAYDDEKTPLYLTGKKMLPIMQFENGDIQNESLDIVKRIDKNSILNWDHLLKFESEINNKLSLWGEVVHNLAMPYWIWTPEFNSNSREYFQTKKEIKRGPFKNLVNKKDQYFIQINELLNKELLPNLSPFYKSSQLTIVDIMIASHLWGLYIVPEFQFHESTHKYLMSIKELCHFNYHEDFWK